jgi:ribosomal-protein-alanine N-acetyltransferase
MPISKGAEVLSTTPSALEVTLRPFAVSDLPAVLEIERMSFPSPWKPEVFLGELQNPYARLVVAEQAGRVVGYFCRWLVADEAHILDIAVHPDHRSRGIGKILLKEILAEARGGGACSASLEVRVSNLPALALYHSLGFSPVATRRRYYENGEDALLMVCSLSD